MSEVIFCVGQDRARIAAFHRWARRRGISIRSLKGCYNGQFEESYIVSLEDFRRVRHWCVEEESILFLAPPNQDGERRALLSHTRSAPVAPVIDLGMFRPCQKDEALAQDSWTYDPERNTYFICTRRN